MKKKPNNGLALRQSLKIDLKMKLTTLLLVVSLFQVQANLKSGISLDFENASIGQIFNKIEEVSEFRFLYETSSIDLERKISLKVNKKKITDVLPILFKGTAVVYKIRGRQIVLTRQDYGISLPKTDSLDTVPNRKTTIQQQEISGTVMDANGMPLPGANILEKGTKNGVTTDFDGNFSLNIADENATLVVSYIGFATKEVDVNGQSTINVSLEESAAGLDEVVVVGYGTQKKRDLTGAISSVSTDVLEDRPSISTVQSLQGAVPGLNIGQVNSSGEEPSLSIRGRTSISGAQNPLIVLDGVIFRGNLIDINPSDIQSIDVLKDASSAAVYGSQAANGVIIITTKKGLKGNKLAVNYSFNYSFQEPTKRFLPESPEEHIQRITDAYFYDSRTEDSGYLEPTGDFDYSSILRTSDQVRAFNDNLLTDWYGISTNDNMYAQIHNLSVAKRNNDGGYYLSIGYADQKGYMKNDGYSRINTRINIDNNITDWLKVGVQTFMTSSDYSGLALLPNSRYALKWFAPPYEADGTTLLQNPIGIGTNVYNPMLLMQSDDFDKRLNVFGNVYADFKIPFVPGLSFKANYNINYRTTSQYYFRSYANNFLGEGSKMEGIGKDWTNDYILTYNRTFDSKHQVNATIAYGREKRRYSSTTATASDFFSDVLGYNSLQSGSADLQNASSSAWEETSLYTMNRLFYGYDNKYLFTGTVRTDGFSGFGESNKFGTFPSASVAWILSQEKFLQEKDNFIDFLKLRASYGANGNRTIGRYATLPVVSGGFNYINGDKVPVYTQGNSNLANPNLKWENTVGFNLGADYSIFDSRIKGSIDYYDTNTNDILYDVDIPGISRFEKISDNLGKLHNNGLEASISSINIDIENFRWSTDINFSRNRNELKELLGFDIDGDGKEDDLISEGLFIGESLGAIYDYETSGKLWQLEDDIPNSADVGSYVITDTNGDGVIGPLDRKIIGDSEPSYRLSMNNRFSYKNWMLSIFINSVQGNDKFYLGKDNIMGFNNLNSTVWDNRNFPVGLDFWLPKNPDARYQRLGPRLSDGLAASRYIDRSFVRLQDVNLSYTFGEKALKEMLDITSLRLFFNAKNLYTWTEWPGWDPETGEGITPDGRPVIRSFTLGINVKF